MIKRADSGTIAKLQEQLLNLQAPKALGTSQALPLGLGELEHSFPGGTFAKGAVHEFISTSSESASSTSGFISVILGKLMSNSGYCLWISVVPRRSIFPPALKGFGIDPERILFVDAGRPKETLWAIEEALKCNALVAVVGEITELSFNDSRRLQLAVEKSQVTGFIHRFRPKTENAVACLTRWKISPVISATTDIPGVGFSRWQVALLKVRNGRVGNWLIQWSPQGLDYIENTPGIRDDIYQRQIG